METGKLIDFPQSSESYMQLARYKAHKKAYADAIAFSYTAMQRGEDADSCNILIAQMLMESGNPEEALRYIMTEYPGYAVRSDEVLNIMRECYCEMYETIQEHKIMVELADRGVMPTMSHLPIEIESVLDGFDVMATDALTYGIDATAMDNEWYRVRPVTGIAAVLSALRQYERQDYEATMHRMKAAVAAIEKREPSIPGIFIMENMGTYVISGILTKQFEKIERSFRNMSRRPEQYTISLVNVCAMALMVDNDETAHKNIDNVLETLPTPGRYEIQGISDILVYREKYESALKLFNSVLKNEPYNIGICRQAASCAYDLGEYKLCYDLYTTLSKLLPWDSAVGYYKSKCISKIANRKDSKNENEDSSGGDEGLPYSTDASIDAYMRKRDVLRELIGKSPDELEDELTAEAENIIAAYLSFENYDTQRQFIKGIATFGDEKSWHLLRRLLLDDVTAWKLKEIILNCFSKIYPDERIACCCNGTFIEGVTDMCAELDIYKEIYDEYKKCYHIAKKYYGIICAMAFNSYCEYFLPILGEYANDDGYNANALMVKLLIMALNKCGCEDAESDVLVKHYPDTDADAVKEIVEVMDDCEREFLHDLCGND